MITGFRTSVPQPHHHRSWRHHTGRRRQTTVPWLSWNPANWWRHNATCPWPGGQSPVHVASFDLQTVVEPLPLDQLLCYAPSTVQSWPTAGREEILAVAHRDMVVARRNISDFSRYLDTHAAHLAACAGAMDDTVPLMAAETFPRLPGVIRSALQDMQRD